MNDTRNCKESENKIVNCLARRARTKVPKAKKIKSRFILFRLLYKKNPLCFGGFKGPPFIRLGVVK